MRRPPHSRRLRQCVSAESHSLAHDCRAALRQGWRCGASLRLLRRGSQRLLLSPRNGGQRRSSGDSIRRAAAAAGGESLGTHTEHAHTKKKRTCTNTHDHIRSHMNSFAPLSHVCDVFVLHSATQFALLLASGPTNWAVDTVSGKWIPRRALIISCRSEAERLGVTAAYVMSSGLSLPRCCIQSIAKFDPENSRCLHCAALRMINVLQRMCNHMFFSMPSQRIATPRHVELSTHLDTRAPTCCGRRRPTTVLSSPHRRGLFSSLPRRWGRGRHGAVVEAIVRSPSPWLSIARQQYERFGLLRRTQVLPHPPLGGSP